MGTRLRDWVDAYGGVPKLSEKLCISPWTVRIWLRGGGAPTAEMIMKLIKLSKNKLTFQDIYNEATKLSRGSKCQTVRKQK